MQTKFTPAVETQEKLMPFHWDMQPKTPLMKSHKQPVFYFLQENFAHVLNIAGLETAGTMNKECKDVQWYDDISQHMKSALGEKSHHLLIYYGQLHLMTDSYLLTCLFFLSELP